MLRHATVSFSIVLLIGSVVGATEPRLTAETFEGLELRGIGPALMSGRIADIAVDPADPATWYVAVGSGGVWKTVNAGTTWEPLFDDESSYSVGCVTLDPNNPHRIWVGTGENVGGRHVGYGDGIYRSDDRGETWSNLGLVQSEHISKIVVHPENSDVVWVAAQGPLWTPGGERGLYKTDDGGTTWRRVLAAGEWTGVTDLVIDPRDPDRLYAATWQRHRTVAAYMGGGPESGLHRSDDGGETWTRLEQGLPEGNVGKIGLAISPQNPDVLYVAMERNRRTGGVWRSADRGASWTKMSDTVSGATGPHYYQELVASPNAFDRIYLMDVRIQVSDDGGATFRRLTEVDKHSDNHAMAFRADDPNYLLVGTDGGIYESFDLAATWRFVANLPVTQFYKLAVDDAEPFYEIYGGTQDNSTQAGPSRTDRSNGITNEDWQIVLGADGHQPATEPGNPDIAYAQTQVGGLHRVDRRTGEVVLIQPQPGADDPPPRFNWDAPILVSPHSPTSLYTANQRLWRSDDRGDSWVAVSDDLTRDEDRMLRPFMGRQWSWDAPWDMGAMSNFHTITNIAESPLVEGLLYVGTDDGLIQVSEDGGDTWRAIDVASLPGVPAEAFVNDLEADLHDADTVYVALDHHKQGDFSPYLLKSTDRGRSWVSIAGDLPERHLVWRLVQDHVKPELLFAGTEFGVFFSVDGGDRWVELTGGVPTIPFRDLVIQRRENDLVGATFGRGFYVLDDYTVLREVTEERLAEEATLFPIRPAWWYLPRRSGRSAQGGAFFAAPNPPFGAVFTYHLRDELTTAIERRQKAEEPLIEAGEDTPFPGWDEVERERREADPAILLTVRDEAGRIVRRLDGETGAGIHRTSWDLRLPATDALGLTRSEWEDEPSGPMAPPGTYSVTLSRRVEGVVTDLSGPVSFEVRPLRDGSLEGADPADAAAFWARVEATQRSASAARMALSEHRNRLEAMVVALGRSTADPGDLDTDLEALRQELLDLDLQLNGHRSMRQVGEPRVPSIADRVGRTRSGVRSSTYGPTPNLERNLEIAEAQLQDVVEQLNRIGRDTLPSLANRLQQAGAPWSPGQPIP
jgi:photosystem II stability/assembly factor-like uncharacterized protein